MNVCGLSSCVGHVGLFVQEEIHLFMGVRPNLCLINLLLGLKKTITNTLTSSKAESLAPRIITPQMFQESLPNTACWGRSNKNAMFGAGFFFPREFLHLLEVVKSKV